MATDTFLDAFFSIDTDNSEEITIDELESYMQKNNFEESFVEKWLKIFDLDQNGRITLEEYCETLGLVAREARVYRKETFNQKAAAAAGGRRNTFPPGVEVISHDMNVEWQIDIADFAHQLSQKSLPPNEMVKQLRQMLEARFGRLWHVVIAVGQYWSHYSYEPGHSFHFKLGRHIFLVWKTPLLE